MSAREMLIFCVSGLLIVLDMIDIKSLNTLLEWDYRMFERIKSVFISIFAIVS
jgi:hypothetical protein